MNISWTPFRLDEIKLCSCQFSDGFSTLSTTKSSVCAFVDSSFRKIFALILLQLFAKYLNISLMATIGKLTFFVLVFIGFASSAVAQYTPTISGINAWWWLGGIVYDGLGCSTTPPGSCYWSEAPLTANPNGAPGSPVWNVSTVAGGGSVSLNCNTCTSVVATATAPSNGCVYDVTVTVSYGPYQSASFHILINTIADMTLVGGYPTNSSFLGNGYDSQYVWNATDVCGSEVYGLDGNESYGSWTDDYYLTQGYYNTWNLPGVLTPNPYYFSSYLWADDIKAQAAGANDPNTTHPQSPLQYIYVEDNYPWTLHAFSQTIGAGLLIHSDDQQWYIDHGEHQ
jgi:hypothetical protein